MTKYLTILRFFLVGGTTALIYFGLTYLLVEGLAMHVTLASSVAYITGVCYNYLMHYHWTFSTDAPHGQALVKYVVTCVGSIVLNALVMHFGVQLSSVHYMVVQLFAGVVLVSWSLTMSAFWVFRTR